MLWFSQVALYKEFVVALAREPIVYYWTLCVIYCNECRFGTWIVYRVEVLKIKRYMIYVPSYTFLMCWLQIFSIYTTLPVTIIFNHSNTALVENYSMFSPENYSISIVYVLYIVMNVKKVHDLCTEFDTYFKNGTWNVYRV